MNEVLSLKIIQEFNEFQEMTLKKSPFEIFNDYYKIYLMNEVKNFFDCCEIPEEWEEKLLEVQNILEALYGYELGYDEPQFMTWEAIEHLIKDFLTEFSQEEVK